MSRHILVGQAEGESKNLVVQELDLDLPSGKRLVEQFNITLEKGDRLILMGPSGSGKSTLAKAILDLWDHGEGNVTLPSGATIMAVSQKAYFPNTNLRGILSAPKMAGSFNDEELVEVLKAVGHDRLIQHIPGAQVKITMDGILSAVPAFLTEYDAMGQTDGAFEEIKKVIGIYTGKLTCDQFDYVQYVPEEQKVYFRTHFDEIQKRTLGTALSEEQIDSITDCVIDKMDQTLADRVLDKITDKAYSSAKGRASKSPSKLGYFMWNLKRGFNKSVSNYMANKDTDDLSREIKLNEKQTEYIKTSLLERIEDSLREEHCKKGGLKSLFNALTWPASILYQPYKAKKAAKDMKQDLAVFMDTQNVTGNKFASQLSGGEQQKLMFARVLLHKPDILILDEITAAIDEEGGDKLYREMVEKMPDALMISIAHNEHIIKHHTHHAELDPENKAITVKPIQPQP